MLKEQMFKALQEHTNCEHILLAEGKHWNVICRIEDPILGILLEPDRYVQRHLDAAIMRTKKILKWRAWWQRRMNTMQHRAEWRLLRPLDKRGARRWKRREGRKLAKAA